MSDTHINAYFIEVQEAEAKVQTAKNELEAAKLRLEDKKREVGFEDPTETSHTEDDVREAALPSDEATALDKGPQKHQDLADSQGDNGPLDSRKKESKSVFKFKKK